MLAHPLLYGTRTGTPGISLVEVKPITLLSNSDVFKTSTGGYLHQFFSTGKSMEELNSLFLSLNIEGREGIMSERRDL